MVQLFSFHQKVDLAGFTLIVPSVSVGNVPQLTADLLITSLNCKKAASIWHPAIVPAIGADPYDEKSPEACTACELYINETLKLAILQLRSTLHGKLATAFFNSLKKSLLEFKIQDVVVLTSSYDHELHVISSNKYYFISDKETVVNRLTAMGVKPKEKEFDGKYHVHGSGFAVKLWEILHTELDCTVLIKFVSEGDNRPDAIATIELLNQFVDNINKSGIKSLTFPYSWNNLFGGPPPLGIY